MENSNITETITELKAKRLVILYSLGIIIEEPSGLPSPYNTVISLLFKFFDFDDKIVKGYRPQIVYRYNKEGARILNIKTVKLRMGKKTKIYLHKNYNDLIREILSKYFANDKSNESSIKKLGLQVLKYKKIEFDNIGYYVRPNNILKW